ncbi:MAG: hypothetical protein H7256_09155 [Bdellovibrio sp.]|nr:hypothetical protein [Bdellovibrio sp.]
MKQKILFLTMDTTKIIFFSVVSFITITTTTVHQGANASPIVGTVWIANEKGNSITVAHAEENVKMHGKMDMNLMKGMIHECMEKNKDEKLCHNNIMMKCEKNMAQNECQTMMTQSMKK